MELKSAMRILNQRTFKIKKLTHLMQRKLIKSKSMMLLQRQRQNLQVRLLVLPKMEREREETEIAGLLIQQMKEVKK